MNQHPAEQDTPRYRAQLATSSGPDCRLVDDSIEEYSLGVAGSSQQVAIERHMIQCQRCSTLIASYQETVAALALAVPLASPPASARTALISRVATTPQSVAPYTSVYSGSLDTLRTPSLPASNPIAAPMPSQSPGASPWWRVYAAPLATLPLLLALGLMGGWGFNNLAKLNDANGVIAMRDAEIDNMNDSIVPVDPDWVELAFSSSTKHYNMTSETGSQSATLIADTITGQAALQAKGLAAGSYSILVQMQDGTMVQKAVFDVGDDGTATTAVDLGDAMADFQSVHIRTSSPRPETDMAVDEQDATDVLMTLMGPNINQGSGTGIQGS